MNYNLNYIINDCVDRKWIASLVPKNSPKLKVTAILVVALAALAAATISLRYYRSTRRFGGTPIPPSSTNPPNVPKPKGPLSPKTVPSTNPQVPQPEPPPLVPKPTEPLPPKTPQPPCPAPTLNPVTAKPLPHRNPTPVSSPIESPHLNPGSNLSPEPSRPSSPPPSLPPLEVQYPENMIDLIAWVKSQSTEQQLRLFIHVHMDMHASESIFQGHESKYTYGYLRGLLSVHWSSDHPILKQLVQLERLANKSWSDKTAEEMGLQISDLPIGEWYHCPGGWRSQPNHTSREDPGHETIYSFERTSENSYNFYLLNTGDGIEYHDAIDTDAHQKFAPAVVWKNISADSLFIGNGQFRNDFIKILGELNYTQVTGKAVHPELLYQEIVGKYFGKSFESLDQVGLFLRPQQSGTCTWRVLLALLLLRSQSPEEYKKTSYLVNASSLYCFAEIFKDNIENPSVEGQQIRTCLAMVSEHFLVRNARYHNPEFDETSSLISSDLWHRMGELALKVKARVDEASKKLASALKRRTNSPVPQRALHYPQKTQESLYRGIEQNPVNLSQKILLTAPVFNNPAMFSEEITKISQHIKMLYETDPKACGKMVQDVALQLPLPEDSFWGKTGNAKEALMKLQELFEMSVFLLSQNWNCYSLDSLVGLSFMAAIHTLALKADHQYRNDPSRRCEIPDLNTYGVWLDDSADRDIYLTDTYPQLHERRENLIRYFRTFNQGKEVLFKGIRSTIDPATWQESTKDCGTFLKTSFRVVPSDICDLMYYEYIIRNTERYKDIEKARYLDSPEAYLSHCKATLPKNFEESLELIFDDMNAFQKVSPEEWCQAMSNTSYKVLFYCNWAISNWNTNRCAIFQNGTMLSEEEFRTKDDLERLKARYAPGEVLIFLPRSPYDQEKLQSIISGFKSSSTGQVLAEFCKPFVSPQNCTFTPLQMMTLRWMVDFGQDDVRTSLLKADGLDHLIAFKRAQILLRMRNSQSDQQKAAPPWKMDIPLKQDLGTGYTRFNHLSFRLPTFCGLKGSFSGGSILYSSFERVYPVKSGVPDTVHREGAIQNRTVKALAAPQSVAAAHWNRDAYSYFHTTAETRPYDVVAFFRENLDLLKVTYKTTVYKRGRHLCGLKYKYSTQTCESGVDFLIFFLTRSFLEFPDPNIRLKSRVPLFEQVSSEAFINQFEALFKEAFALYFENSSRSDEDLQICCGLVRALQMVRKALSTGHLSYARLTVLEEFYLSEMEVPGRSKLNQQGAIALVRMLSFEDSLNLTDHQRLTVFKSWITYQFLYDHKSSLVLPETIQAGWDFIYSQSADTCSLSLSPLCDQVLQLLGLAKANRSWTGQFPTYQSISNAIGEVEYSMNLLQGRIANSDGELALANQQPSWRQSGLANTLFEQRVHIYLSQGTVLAFEDPVWGRCRVLPVRPGIDKDITLENRFQVFMEGRWQQLMGPGKLLGNLPFSFVAEHLLWFAGNEPQGRTIITTKTGQPVAVWESNALKPYKDSSHQLSTPTLEEANYYVPFENPAYLIVEKLTQGPPLIQKLIVPRYQTDRGTTLTFERMTLPGTQESRLVRTDQRNKFVPQHRLEGLLGSYRSYIYLEDTRGGASMLVPVLPFREMEDFSTHAEPVNPVENAPRAGDLGEWSFLDHKFAKKYAFVELQVEQGKPRAVTPEGHLFLAYLALAQKRYEEAVQHLRGWEQWPVQTKIAGELLSMISRSGNITHDFSAKAVTVRNYLKHTYRLDQKHYLPWRMRTTGIPHSLIVPNPNQINTNSCLPRPPGAYNGCMRHFMTLAALKELAEREKHLNINYDQFDLYLAIRGSTHTPSMLASKVAPSFLFYYKLAVSPDPEDLRDLELRLRYALFSEGKPLESDLKDLLLFAYHNPKLVPQELSNKEVCDELLTLYISMHHEANKKNSSVRDHAEGFHKALTFEIPLIEPVVEGPLKIEWNMLEKSTPCPCPGNQLAADYFQTEQVYTAEQISQLKIDNPFLVMPTLSEEESVYQNVVNGVFNKYAESLDIGTRLNRSLELKVSLTAPLNDLCTALIALKEFLTIERDECGERILALLNKRSSQREEAFRERLLQESGHLPLFTLEDLLPWLLRGRGAMGELSKYNKYLTGTELDQIWHLAQSYLFSATHVQQLERADKLAKEVKQTKNDRDRANAVKKLYTELSKQRQYNPTNSMPLLVFEYASNLLLRPSQYSSLRALYKKEKNQDQFRNVVRQIIMGDGKTTVAAKVLSLFRCQPGKMSLFIPFTPQFGSLTEDLGFSMKSKFGQSLQAIDTPFSKMDKVELSAMRDRLEEALSKGELIMMKKEGMLFLLLKTLSTLCNYTADASSQSLSENADIFDLCCSILNLWEQCGEAIGDEAHDLLDVTKTVNVPQGERQEINPEDVAVGHKIFQHLALLLDQTFTVDGETMQGREAVNMVVDEEGKQVPRQIDLKVYQQSFIPEIARHLTQWHGLHLPEEQKEGCTRYLCGMTDAKTQTAVDKNFMTYLTQLFEKGNDADKKQADAIALARDMLQVILPFTLNRKLNSSYGRVNAQIMALHGVTDGAICPYSESQPASTKFGNEIEELCYYYQAALIQGITFTEFADWVANLTLAAQLHAEELGIPIEATPEAYALQEITGLSIQDAANERALKDIFPTINADSSKKLEVETYNICQQIKVDAEYLSAGPHHFVKTVRSIQAFSGTTGNPEEYHHSIQVQETKGTEGRILDRFLTKPSLHLHVKTQSAGTFLEESFASLSPIDIHDTNAVIDAGAFFRGQPNRAVAELLLKQSQENPNSCHIEGVLYFDFPPKTDANVDGEYPDSLFFLKKSEAEPIFVGKTDRETIEGLGIPLKDILVFYDNRHITSTDLPLPPAAISLLTWSERQILTKDLQGAVRAREYLDGDQRIYFVGVGKTLISGQKEAQAAKEEAFEFSNKALQSYFSQLETAAWFQAMKEIRQTQQAAPDAISGFQQAHAKFIRAKKLLVASRTQSHYRRCGALSQQETTLSMLVSEADRLKRRLEKSSIPSEEFKQEAEIIIAKAANARMLPEYMSTSALHLGMEKTLEAVSDANQEEAVRFDLKGMGEQREQIREAEIEADRQQEAEAERQQETEIQQELREEMDNQIRKAIKPSNTVGLGPWSDDEVEDFLDQALNGDHPLTRMALPTQILTMDDVLAPPNAEGIPDVLRQEFAPLFQGAPLYMTANQRYTFEDKNGTIFHPSNKPTSHILMLKRPSGIVAIMLAMGKAEADVFHSVLKRQPHEKSVWMLHIDGSMLHDEPSPSDSDLSEAELTHCELLLWQANFFEFRVNYLVKQMKLGKEWWAGLTADLQKSAIQFLSLRASVSPRSWAKRSAFIAHFESQTQPKTPRNLSNLSSFSKAFVEGQKTGLKHYSSSEFFHLPLYLVAVVRPEDVHKLDPHKHYQLLRGPQVSLIRPDLVAHINPSEFSWLTTEQQIAQIKDGDLPGLTEKQVKLLADERLKLLKLPKLIRAIPPAKIRMENLLQSQLEHLSPCQIGQLRDLEVIANLSPNQNKDLHPDVISTLSDDLLQYVQTKAQLEQLPKERYGALRHEKAIALVAPEDVTRLDPSVTRYLQSPKQVNALFESDLCEKYLAKITPRLAGLVSEANIDILIKKRPDLISNINPKFVEHVPIESINRIHPNAVGYLTDEVKLKALNPRLISMVQPRQMQYLELEQLTHLCSIAQLENLKDYQMDEICATENFDFSSWPVNCLKQFCELRTAVQYPREIMARLKSAEEVTISD